jgi:transcriptional regulator with PAS, ATPase and Fis domain
MMDKEIYNMDEINSLRKIFDTAYDGLLVVNTKGIIMMMSQAYRQFLNIGDQIVIGRHVTDVIENTRLHIVAETGVAEIAQLQKIHDTIIVASRIPIEESGRVIGAVGKIVFRDIQELDDMHNKINGMEKQLRQYKDELAQMNSAKYSFDHIIGDDHQLLKVKKLAKRATGTNSNVLIIGESGTGKELFAHAIHKASLRSNEPFIRVNCAAIPNELLESELFGYEEGSFTGAKKSGKIGKFEVADHGTIFLDEIGDMPMHMQAKLLRVIQEREIERIGSNAPKRIDVRIIAATNRNVEQMINNKKFRLDLYYRLNVINLHIPALREHRDDIPEYCRYFIDRYRSRYLKPIHGISEEALSCLMAYNWPGNVRELENVIERAINIIENEVMIKPAHLPLEISKGISDEVIVDLKTVVEGVERETIIRYLHRYNDNKSQVAKVLGLSRTALYDKIRRYAIKSVNFS